MTRWNIEKGRATLPIFGGALVVDRGSQGGLRSVWTSPDLPDIPQGLKTRLAHVGRFAMAPDLVERLGATPVSLRLTAKWAGAKMGNTPESHAFEMRLFGWRGPRERLDIPEHAFAKPHALPDPEGDEAIAFIPGAACWIAPVAVKQHLALFFKSYLHAFEDEPPPELFLAEKDPF
jgi:hypothetical protein